LCFFFWSCLAAVIVSKDYGTLLCQRITVLLYIVVVAARERTRPPRQVGPPVLLRPRLREPPAVIEAISGLGHPCKTQAARGARAEALASRAKRGRRRGPGAHHFLEPSSRRASRCRVAALPLRAALRANRRRKPRCFLVFTATSSLVSRLVCRSISLFWAAFKGQLRQRRDSD
jgi:hypothetical protein